jgi:hypothetical protein
MNILSFFYHVFIFLLGVLLSIPFALLLLYIFKLNTSYEHIHHVASLLFPSKQPKSDILTIPNNEQSFHSVWMFGIIITHIKHSNRAKLQSMYLKLHQQYLLIHLTSKRIKHFHRNKIFFSEVLILNLSQAKIELKPYEQLRTQYWSNKIPIILTQLQSLARYRIHKNKIDQQQDNTLDSKVMF